ncbi:carboxypeptidase-like regulatory domain-containing protein [Anatilimnocola sp. NA78]|uniref:carboxypeptidase-like regulatory domain-containing protein n=1 Tax=Anatilimnocola sp. NA78 TaxID=3415683 RepID=UPI003CE588CB
MDRCLMRLSLLSLLVVGVGGCSNEGTGNHPRVVKATGIVRYQGQPVADADVTFNNPNAGQTGTAKTDSAGRFALSTFGKADGVVPGPQLVAIRRVDVIDNTPPGVDVSAGGASVPPTIRWLVPEKYSNIKTSGLSVEVKDGETNEFPFDLK